ncbi:phosphomannomutase [Pelagovum pacificum]|uniref:Phosphomannomutase n=1 Tax=Pelagovum pacificum TaxID=2588711 RepID=A0A5C5G931_9RHOB|nr:phosphomannomutase [Pelagovum pacificum]QQA45085.1 phosphomannomutase [Pelagovum pacificum]TNY30542.1 phosphomannomutase [Pelagovum pacificum]
MAPKFGTSGLRGLVVEMTEPLIADHVTAFLASCDTGGRLLIGRDLRPSSPEMAATVAAAARAAGADVTDCGALPTPALALAALEADAGAVMVTGSHIPADRNGLKFYTRKGEITKADEAAITGALGAAPGGSSGGSETDEAAADRFVARYVSAFGPAALTGRRIGLYAHSAVGRDMLAEVLSGLGADVVELARSDIFIPVDTEAVDPETRSQLTTWIAAHGLDAIASTDGDSDRPMLTDETGRVIPGDVLGQITAKMLGAEVVVTPISSNSGVLEKGFGRVLRTKIGSPFVIAGMEEAGGKVAGYEANGGFLLGFEAEGPAGPLPALPTRDSFLPIVAPLVAAGGALSALVAAEPARFTAADRLQEIPTERSRALLDSLLTDAAARADFLAFAGEEAGQDTTDGLRMTTVDGTVIHLRPSGNAPEFRLYVEADSRERAEELLAAGLQRLSTVLAG